MRIIPPGLLHPCLRVLSVSSICRRTFVVGDSVVPLPTLPPRSVVDSMDLSNQLAIALDQQAR
jgi:hypothetical protein